VSSGTLNLAQSNPAGDTRFFTGSVAAEQDMPKKRVDLLLSGHDVNA